MVNRVHVKNSNSRKDKGKKIKFMNHLTVEELIKAGAHFGHPTHRWNPNYKKYISMKKNGVYIIDMEQTNRCMVKAAEKLTQIVKNGGNVSTPRDTPPSYAYCPRKFKTQKNPWARIVLIRYDKLIRIQKEKHFWAAATLHYF